MARKQNPITAFLIAAFLALLINGVLILVGFVRELDLTFIAIVGFVLFLDRLVKAENLILLLTKGFRRG